jgi:hypothetical protein
MDSKYKKGANKLSKFERYKVSMEKLILFQYIWKIIW